MQALEIQEDQEDAGSKKRNPKNKNQYDKEPLLPKRNSTFNLLCLI